LNENSGQKDMPVKPVLLGWIMYFNVMKIKVMEAAAF
jgi:hypothetical protein